MAKITYLSGNKWVPFSLLVILMFCKTDFSDEFECLRIRNNSSNETIIATLPNCADFVEGAELQRIGDDFLCYVNTVESYSDFSSVDHTAASTIDCSLMSTVGWSGLNALSTYHLPLRTSCSPTEHDVDRFTEVKFRTTQAGNYYPNNVGIQLLLAAYIDGPDPNDQRAIDNCNVATTVECPCSGDSQEYYCPKWGSCIDENDQDMSYDEDERVATDKINTYLAISTGYSDGGGPCECTDSPCESPTCLYDTFDADAEGRHWEFYNNAVLRSNDKYIKAIVPTGAMIIKQDGDGRKRAYSYVTVHPTGPNGAAQVSGFPGGVPTYLARVTLNEDGDTRYGIDPGPVQYYTTSNTWVGTTNGELDFSIAQPITTTAMYKGSPVPYNIAPDRADLLYYAADNRYIMVTQPISEPGFNQEIYVFWSQSTDLIHWDYFRPIGGTEDPHAGSSNVCHTRFHAGTLPCTKNHPQISSTEEDQHIMLFMTTREYPPGSCVSCQGSESVIYKDLDVSVWESAYYYTTQSVNNLKISKVSNQMYFNWDDSSRAHHYAVYQGTIGNYYSHDCEQDPLYSSEWYVQYPSGDRYFIVVSHDSTHYIEGAYGKDSNNICRPEGTDRCLTQPCGP
ncbi:MAG TPA: hypothetical protein PK014_11490 [Thermoanaerobaculia bacterium]|nr:hypothetical protein [Thermoanaerobaculia bacterium]HUM30720.1 hypothetical protein [Thermoanaerobaculia bacterium]HXK68991.1 hypothetical protein [Thermoanaerobaculia bacterium]